MAGVVICSLLGLVQYAALERNELLEPEDLQHAELRPCLYSTLACKQEYALIFEAPAICHGCREFYHCLGVDIELAALEAALDALFISRVKEPITDSASLSVPRP